MTDPRTDVALPAQFTEMASMIARLQLETQLPDDGFRVDIASIMENILRADTEEEIFARQDAGSVASKDFTNRPFFLKSSDVTWKMTAAGFREQGAFPFFALLKVRDADTGQDVVVNAGGATVVAVLDKLTRIGALDEERCLMFVEKPVTSGFSVILLRPVKVASGNAKK